MPPATEQTPLIQTVIVTPPRQRYSHSYLRRFCTVALGFVLVIVIILFLIPSKWLPGNQSDRDWAPVPLPWSSSPQDPWPEDTGFKYEDLQKILLETPSEDKARKWSQHYTAKPHLAGKGMGLAEWTRDKWLEFGIQAKLARYDVYLNYPVSHRLALLEDDTTSQNSELKVKHECSLEEDVLDEDPTTGLKDRVPTFNGYSANGNVTAQYVFVNFGTFYDFEDLLKAGVELEGKIAIAKYGHNFRGLKVKRAQELGMVGIVIYSDPQQDGNITELNGYEAYPNGPARQPSSVQRGSVQFINILPGDPTTPGYPSLPGAPREYQNYSYPSIPSIPISYQDALPLLRALNGHGPRASDLSKYWHGGGLSHKDVEYNIGPSPPDLVLNLQNEQDYGVRQLYNVIGVINGTLSDEVIVLGNHRDAWIAGGAGDPNSGSSTLNELIRSFGIALEKGWKPLRTIVFASWDGEEYGLIGSTEWVEEYIPWLSHSAIAYLNLDASVSGGQRFSASATPLLNQALRYAASHVPSPNQTVPGQTLFDLWDGEVGTLGSGSDYTAFLDHAGITSAQFAFGRGAEDPVWHYHSNYDSFAWMSKFGDPSFEYHVAASKLLGLLAVYVAEKPLIGFNATDYAKSLSRYLDSVRSSLESNTSSTSSSSSSSKDPFPGLSHAISNFHTVAVDLDAASTSLTAELAQHIPWWRWWRKAQLRAAVLKVNRKYINLERHFLHEEGLEGRPWFKHVVYAPGIWTGYAGATFPGLVEALQNAGIIGGREEKGNGQEVIEDKDVKKWAKIIESRINAATKELKS